jgi:hypothetical protein
MRGAACACAIAIACAASDARADEPPQTTESADALVRHGVELRKQGNDEAALAEFSRAFALDPTPAHQAQVALAEQALGRWIAAEVDLGAALAAKDDPWVERNRAALEGAMRIVARHLGWVIVSVNVEGAELSLDGRPLRPGESRVPAASSVLLVRAPGYEPDVRRIDVPPEGRAQIHVELTSMARPAPVAVPAPAPPPEIVAPARPSRIAPLTLGAIAIAGIGVGSYFGIRTFVKKGERDDHCPTGIGCDPTGHAADDDARSSATISTISFAVGGAAGVASALWLVLDRAPTSKTIAMPFVDRGACGLLIQGAL